MLAKCKNKKMCGTWTPPPSLVKWLEVDSPFNFQRLVSLVFANHLDRFTLSSFPTFKVQHCFTTLV